ADYVDHGSDEAFRKLATSYLDLVYSTALRLVGGDTHLAEDVAQTVFVDLARQAKRLSAGVKLGGWLHRHTCFVAANSLRGERRRQARERQALMDSLPDHPEAHLGQVAPILDEAINQLGAADRAAVLLRYYEHLDFRAVGEALGTSEAAAQKRVARALDKLHLLLKHRGVAYSAAALGTALAGEAVTAAPAALAASISGTALASATAGAGTTLTLLEIMASSKLKTGILAAIGAACFIAPLLVEHAVQARQRGLDETWRSQSNEINNLSADNQRLAGVLVQANNTPSAPDQQYLEVLKLRGEVARLRQVVMNPAPKPTPAPPVDQLAAMKQMYAARVDRLKQWLEANPAEKIPELQNLDDSTWLVAADSLQSDDDFAGAASNLRDNAEGQVFDTMWSALRKYAKANNGQFPADLSQLAPYFRSPIDDAILQRYEIVPANSLDSELQPGGDWVITQKAPVNPDLDSRMAFGITQMRNADSRDTNRWTAVQQAQ
ncbi:MAG TPA: sigma-70 family RNA polymerase sigma factor, partial [Candidatus Acidoferrum sp.]|nr:sigma-70 family RNA polymerase sigma factor [Candidatus Acidoferrum sp.]